VHFPSYGIQSGSRGTCVWLDRSSGEDRLEARPNLVKGLSILIICDRIACFYQLGKVFTWNNDVDMIEEAGVVLWLILKPASGFKCPKYSIPVWPRDSEAIVLH
jgi:hypothetical protein